MPDHIEQVDAAVAFEHAGARIYHCYRSDDVDCGTYDYWYSTDSDSRHEDIPPTFDVRELAKSLDPAIPQMKDEPLEVWSRRVFEVAIDRDLAAIARGDGGAIREVLDETDTLLEWNAENYPGIDRDVDPDGATCPFPFPTIPYSLTHRSAIALVNWLLVMRSAWFELVPLPDDKFRVTVKQELVGDVDAFLAL